MVFKKEEIYHLIPQRPPIVMVDVVWSATEDGAETGLTVSGHRVAERANHKGDAPRFKRHGIILSI